MMKNLLAILSLCGVLALNAQTPLLNNVDARQTQTLCGKWRYIVDPLDNGYYDYRLMPLKNGFFENREQKHPSELIEYNFRTSPVMDIPSDWNTANPQLFFYEGSVWFQKDFQLTKVPGHRTLIYFGAVNYSAMVWINGQWAGEHAGGYTSFNFDVTDLLKDGDNFVVVRVNNTRQRDNVPTVNMDWWNYGGITREVKLVGVPDTYIQDYSVQLQKGKKDVIAGWVQLNNAKANEPLTLEIPELKVKRQLVTDANGMAGFEFSAKPQLWSPEKPKLYDVVVGKAGERIVDHIGFRTIETKDKSVLLNGQKVFLRGISIHEEAAYRNGRAWSKDDALALLGWAKELGCNFVRLAHYPHNETMVREAERLGLMVWSEIPVYWTISWENQDTYQNARNQLTEMIARDKNRAAIVIWSIANETPHGQARDLFLGNLAKHAKSLDDTRLISMAMEVTRAENGLNRLDDNMNQYVDIVSFNQYLGWYRGTPDDCRIAKWEIPYNKPVFISEFGGSALQGMHGDVNQRFTEEYQEELYIRTLEMLDKIDGFSGVSPWILKDFRSARRQLPDVQDFFNRKGVISDQGIKKKAFYVLQDFYRQKELQYKAK
ncbi:MAG: glycoside hydrolase family 2 TIM barrel-domain containing protein [Breznakibacter sp.]